MFIKYQSLYKNILLLIPLVISCLVLPQFCFSQAPQVVESPGTFTEAKDFVIRIVKPLPNMMKNSWQNDVLPFWHKMGEKSFNSWNSSILPWLNNIFPTLKSWFNEACDWLLNIWNKYVKPSIQNLLNKIRSLFNKEIEEKKPFIEEEFKKEKEEIKEEIPEISKSFWERFKFLFK